MKSLHDEKERQLENMEIASGVSAQSGTAVPKLVNTTPSASINFDGATSTRSNGSQQLGSKKKAADFYFKKQTSTVQKNLAVKTDFMTQDIKPVQQPHTTRAMYDDGAKASKSPIRRQLTGKGQTQHYVKA